MNLVGCGYYMNISEYIVPILIAVTPLAIVYQRKIRLFMDKILSLTEEDEEDQEEIEESEEIEPSTKDKFLRIEFVHEVEEVQVLDCYEDREVIKVNGSYQTVEIGAVEEGDLVYIGRGKGIRSLHIMNPPTNPSHVSIYGRFLYQESFASGYRKLARMSEEDIRGRYKFAK